MIKYLTTIKTTSSKRRCYGGMDVSTRRSATRYLRRLRAVVASLALQSPGSFWCAGLGRLLASAVWLRVAPGPGTDYQRPSDHQNCHWLYSKRQLKSSLTSVDVRRLDVCSSTRQCRLQLRVSIPSSGAVVTVQRVRRRLQMSRLNSTHMLPMPLHYFVKC